MTTDLDRIRAAYWRDATLGRDDILALLEMAAGAKQERAMTERPVSLPPLFEKGYLGDDASYGYDGCDMQDYARAAILADRESQQELMSQLANDLRAATAEAARARDVLRVAVEALKAATSSTMKPSKHKAAIAAIRAHLGEKQ